MAADMEIGQGQRWRSAGDGHVLEVVDRASFGWILRFVDSGVQTTVDEADLLDSGMYELMTAS